jgi:cytochrome b pre-mRNA-processing protein 3
MFTEPLLGRAARLDFRPGLPAGPRASICWRQAGAQASLKDGMLGFLFPRLTAERARGANLFAAATREARQRHWYAEGQVPDTLDGRFAMLTTIAALILVRLEQCGPEGDAASVALTERFIEVMESEHRELGLGDPKLGRTVRKLVGSLARRTELWRLAVMGERKWSDVTRQSVYHAEASADALTHSAAALRRFWKRLEQRSAGELMDGRID